MSVETPAPIAIDRSRLHAAAPPEHLRADHTLAGAFLVGFALVGLLISGGMMLSDWQWDRSALRAEADVLEVLGSKNPRARVRFTDAQGVEHLAEATGPFNGIRATVGERIPILYQPRSTSYVSHDDPQREWIGVALFAALPCLPLLALPFMWRQVRRQERRYARLRQLGLKRTVETVRTERVPWGKFTRWAVVATWRDGVGRVHQTLAGPFSYDPAPLDPATLFVLADSLSPEQSVIAPESLPDFARWGRHPRSGAIAQADASKRH